MEKQIETAKPYCYYTGRNRDEGDYVHFSVDFPKLNARFVVNEEENSKSKTQLMFEIDFKKEEFSADGFLLNQDTPFDAEKMTCLAASYCFLKKNAKKLFLDGKDVKGMALDELEIIYNRKNNICKQIVDAITSEKGKQVANAKPDWAQWCQNLFDNNFGKGKVDIAKVVEENMAVNFAEAEKKANLRGVAKNAGLFNWARKMMANERAAKAKRNVLVEKIKS